MPPCAIVAAAAAAVVVVVVIAAGAACCTVRTDMIPAIFRASLALASFAICSSLAYDPVPSFDKLKVGFPYYDKPCPRDRNDDGTAVTDPAVDVFAHNDFRTRKCYDFGGALAGIDVPLIVR